MTLAEGQDLQVQNEVEVQIKLKTQRSSGRKPRTETRPRACGVCGKAGHNARTCQVVISLSEERIPSSFNRFKALWLRLVKRCMGDSGEVPHSFSGPLAYHPRY